MKVSAIAVAFVVAASATPISFPNVTIPTALPTLPTFTLPPFPTGYLEKRDIDARAYPTAPPKPTGYYGRRRHLAPREANPVAEPGYPVPTGYYAEKREAAPEAEPAYPIPTGYYMDKREGKRAFLPSGYSLPPLPYPTAFPKPRAVRRNVAKEL